jgi:hypothetical protein
MGMDKTKSYLQLALSLIFFLYLIPLIIPDTVLAKSAPPEIDTIVVNTPLPVVHGGSPIQESHSENCPSPATSQCRVDIYTVPPGKLLIIEYVSARSDAAVGDRVSLVVQTQVNGSLVQHYIGLLELHPEAGINADHIGGEMVKLFAGPETTVSMWGRVGTFNNVPHFSGSFSGYLVDIP